MNPLNYLKQAGSYLVNTTPGRVITTFGVLAGASFLFEGKRNTDAVEVNPKNNLEYTLEESYANQSKIGKLINWQRENSEPKKRSTSLERAIKGYKIVKQKGFSDIVSGKIDYDKLSKDVQKNLREVNSLLKTGGYLGFDGEGWTEDCSVADFRTRLYNERGIRLVTFTFIGDSEKGYSLAYRIGKNGPVINFYFHSDEDGLSLDLDELEFCSAFGDDLVGVKKERIVGHLHDALSSVKDALYADAECERRI